MLNMHWMVTASSISNQIIQRQAGQHPGRKTALEMGGFFYVYSNGVRQTQQGIGMTACCDIASHSLTESLSFDAIIYKRSLSG
jgi:hypothetical protein